jgi:hypothetical protein
MKRSELSPFLVDTVFISSTAQDLRAFREMTSWKLKTVYGVREGFPEREWKPDAKPSEITDECHRRVNSSDAFVLILGPWHGWIPPGSRETITHLEFQWARTHFAKLKRSLELFAEERGRPELTHLFSFPRILVLDLGMASALLDRKLPIIKKLTKKEAERIEPYLSRLRAEVQVAVDADEATLETFDHMEELVLRITSAMQLWDRLSAECSLLLET